MSLFDQEKSSFFRGHGGTFNQTSEQGKEKGGKIEGSQKISLAYEGGERALVFHGRRSESHASHIGKKLHGKKTFFLVEKNWCS